ncbi:hypothetical protein ACFWD7_06140 [Streptomyces mirabilis]|uniref:hypothetical protein n=1 Tax=Streptomyces mirabilis TaxID=68239 RepID=UPI0036B44A9D
MSGAEPGEEPRSLLHLSAEQITSYSAETAAEWLLQRNEQHRARLLAACQTLRADSRCRERSYERLSALLAAHPTP